MYVVFAAIGNVRPQPLFDFMYVGNAFFIFVGSTLFGTFQVIQSDREWYQTIRYVYISPISFYVYVMGRAVSKIIVASFAVVITLAFGAFVLNPPVPITISWSSVPVFIVSFILGLFCLLAIGITLGGASSRPPHRRIELAVIGNVGTGLVDPLPGDIEEHGLEARLLHVDPADLIHLQGRANVP